MTKVRTTDGPAMARMYRVNVRKPGIYMEYAKKLIDKGEAYYCFCDSGTLKQH